MANRGLTDSNIDPTRIGPQLYSGSRVYSLRPAGRQLLHQAAAHEVRGDREEHGGQTDHIDGGEQVSHVKVRGDEPSRQMYRWGQRGGPRNRLNPLSGRTDMGKNVPLKK